VKDLGKTPAGGFEADTFVFKENLGSTKWTLYISRPRDNVLLCATQEKYLKELLERKGGTKKGSFLETLKGREEW
jgi:hypothetical protein